MKGNLYVLLGVGRDATMEEIRRAYRRLARRYHPGINPGDAAAAEHYALVTQAFDILTDPVRRREYDTHGDPGTASAEEPRIEFAGFDFSVRAEGASASTFGELFADVLDPGARLPRRAERGADLHASLEIPFETAVKGGAAELTAVRLERCAPCRGLGVVERAPHTCPSCDGSGRVRGIRGHMIFERRCPTCRGRGVVVARPCPACGGEGVGSRAQAIRVVVPPGVADGTELTVPGEGHAGRRGGPAGDLRVRLAVASHPMFRREGADLHVTIPVAVHEAALGARLDIEGLDGPLRLRIPPCTQSGQVFRLRGRGLPVGQTGRGDLVVTTRIVLPAVLDERSKELYRELARLNPEDVRRSGGPTTSAAGTAATTTATPTETLADSR